MNKPKFLPYARQSIVAEDVAAVVAALGADMLTTGPLVEQFETAFASGTCAGHAVSCNSGTAALHLATMGIGLGPGFAAIVPSITFLATANAVRMTGAEVVFSDVDPDTGLMRPSDLETALVHARARSLQVRAALPVHLNGQVCDMAALAEVAGNAGLELIEDACHSLGVAGIGACTHSRFACFSTHPVKAIATGEGGIVTTASAADAQRLRRLRNHGMVRESEQFVAPDLSMGEKGPHPWAYEMQEIGWNYRIPDILCALGISQLARLSELVQSRLRLVEFYDAMFASRLPSPLVRPVPHGERPHGWHLYPLLIAFDRIGRSRDDVMAALRERGIGTQVHYIPVHRQPYYAARTPTDLPGADAYYARCLSIPFFASLDHADARRVVDEIADVVRSERAA